MNLQIDARSVITIAAGVQGSGKSTFALRYLIADRDLSCRFLFDQEGEFCQRLAVSAAETVQELHLAIEDGFVLFDPHTLFPGRMEDAFSWFCAWCYDIASRLPGRKLLMLDEAWKYCSPHSIPQPLANCVQTGRKRGLEMLFATQRPNKLNEAILNEWTEFVCFTLDGEKALDCVEERGADRDEVRNLPLGSFVALNKHTRGVLRGKVF